MAAEKKEVDLFVSVLLFSSSHNKVHGKVYETMLLEVLRRRNLSRCHGTFSSTLARALSGSFFISFFCVCRVITECFFTKYLPRPEQR